MFSRGFVTKLLTKTVYLRGRNPGSLSMSHCRCGLVGMYIHAVIPTVLNFF